MTFDESPSLEEFKDGIPNKLPNPGESQRRVRIMLGALSLLIIVLGIFNAFQVSGVPQILAGKGIVVGTVVDEGGQPVIADIFIIGTNIQDRTDSTGFFKVVNIPNGLQSIVVTQNEGGVEYLVEVIAETVIDLGRIQLVSTPTAEE